MKLWKKLAAALSLGAVCATVTAAPVEAWPDTGPNQWTSELTWANGKYVNALNPLSYTHTISGPGGYTPWTPLAGFDLSIDFRDDASDSGFQWKRESAYIALDGLFCGSLTFPCTGDLGEPTTWEQSFGVFGATLGLFFDGKLNVLITVSAKDILGDFVVARSVLTARAANTVPEPGAIALLAIGLFGAAVSMRKRVR